MKGLRFTTLCLLFAISFIPRRWNAEAIQSKCSACLMVATEFVEVLTHEEPRNHLDMRHRLDASGKRQGKVIDYRVSELRAVELIDSLCARMKGYSLIVRAEGKKEWTSDNPSVVGARGKLVAEEQGKELVRWCDRMLEEKEEVLMRMIREGTLSEYEDLEGILCRELTSNCPPLDIEPMPEPQTAEELAALSSHSLPEGQVDEEGPPSESVPTGEESDPASAASGEADHADVAEQVKEEL